MAQTLERWETDNLRREQDELNMQYHWEAFKPDAVFRVRECLEKDGDLVDLINDLDLEYDKNEPLSNERVNEIVIEAVRGMK